MRQVGEPLIPKYTAQDVRLAAHQVASYFPALSSCEADVIKFLSKKIRSFLKSQRKKINRKKNKENPNPSPMDENAESGDECYEQSDDDEGIGANKETPEASSIPSNSTSKAKKSPRKRCLSEGLESTDFSADNQTSNATNHSVKKVKRSIPNPVPTSDPVPSESEPVQKEFCSQNSQNVKFSEGHFVVLGKDVDEYEFCKVDKVVYHKEFRKYSLDVTYYEEIDGRLEVHPIRKKGKIVKPKKPWTGSKIPLNTIIYNLKDTRLVDSDIKRKICEITKVYS